MKSAEYLAVPEAAELLGVSRSTVWRWIASGKLPAYRLGLKKVRVRKEDLAAVIEPVDKGSEALWASYRPKDAKTVLDQVAGSWADEDADALIAALYRARREGSRAAGRS